MFLSQAYAKIVLIEQIRCGIFTGDTGYGKPTICL